MMKRIGMTALLAFCMVSTSRAQGIPRGAAALGYTNLVINEAPTASDIAPGSNGNFKWFSGQWWQTPPSLDHYSTQEGVLAISLGGHLVSTPRDFTTGALPVLPGKNGFYVEFDVRLSGNDLDYFPAVWLMPVEHNRNRDDQYPDQYPGDPPNYERWMELDVDEGGFRPGLTGTVHSWYGIWEERYQHIQNPNNGSPIPLDRTLQHTFGASYDPINRVVAWWVDDVYQMSATSPYVPDVGALQNFYLILSAQTHGLNKPYTMYVSGVRAFVPLPEPGSFALLLIGGLAGLVGYGRRTRTLTVREPSKT